MRRAILALAVALLWPAAQAAPSGPRLQHAVWLGPGCEQIVDTDDLHGMTGRFIEETGFRAIEATDRLELECFGKLFATKPRVRAFVSARVTITRLVPYHGVQGRLLLNRDTHGVDLEAATLAGLRDPLRRALNASMRGALTEYAKARYGEVTPSKYPWPERIGSICGGR